MIGHFFTRPTRYKICIHLPATHRQTPGKTFTMNSSEQSFDDLIEIMQGFDTAVVITKTADGSLVGRPMAIADCTNDARLWFLTRTDSSTLRDVVGHPALAACMQSGERYLSISGIARTTRDKRQINELWKPGDVDWFEGGKDDPKLIVLEIVPTYGEYWDRSGINGVVLKIQELRARLTGHTLGKIPGKHGDVAF
jgi:general stress protein 26